MTMSPRAAGPVDQVRPMRHGQTALARWLMTQEVQGGAGGAHIQAGSQTCPHVCPGVAVGQLCLGRIQNTDESSGSQATLVGHGSVAPCPSTPVSRLPRGFDFVFDRA